MGISRRKSEKYEFCERALKREIKYEAVFDLI